MSNSARGRRVGRKRKADYNGEASSPEEVRRRKCCEAAQKHRQKKLDELTGLQQRNEQLKREIAEFSEKFKNLKELIAQAEMLMQQHRDAGCSLTNHHEKCQLFAGNILCDDVLSMEQYINENHQPGGDVPASSDENSNSQCQYPIPETSSDPKALFSGETLPIMDSSSHTSYQSMRIQTSSPPESQSFNVKESPSAKCYRVVPPGQHSTLITSVPPKCSGTTTSPTPGVQFASASFHHQGQQVSVPFQANQSDNYRSSSHTNQQGKQVAGSSHTSQYNQQRPVPLQSTQQSQQVNANLSRYLNGRPLSAPSQSNEHSQSFPAPYQMNQMNKQITPTSQRTQLASEFSQTVQADKNYIAHYQASQQVTAVFQTSQRSKHLTAPFNSGYQVQPVTVSSGTSQSNQQSNVLFQKLQQGKHLSPPFQTSSQRQQRATTFPSCESKQITPPFQTNLQNLQPATPVKASAQNQQPTVPGQTNFQSQQFPAAPSHFSQLNQRHTTPPFHAIQQNQNAVAPEKTTITAQPPQSTSQRWKVGTLQIRDEICKVLYNEQGRMIRLPPPLDKELEQDTEVVFENDISSSSTQESQGEEMGGNTYNSELLGKIPKNEVLASGDAFYQSANSANENGFLKSQNINVFENSYQNSTEYLTNSAVEANNNGHNVSDPTFQVPYAQDNAQQPMLQQPTNHPLQQRMGENNTATPLTEHSPCTSGMQSVHRQHAFSKGTSKAMTTLTNTSYKTGEYNADKLSHDYTTHPAADVAPGVEVLSQTTLATTSYNTGKDKNTGVSHNYMNTPAVDVAPRVEVISQSVPSSSQHNKTHNTYLEASPTVSDKLSIHRQHMAGSSTLWSVSTLNSIPTLESISEDDQDGNQCSIDMGPRLRLHNQGKL